MDITHYLYNTFIIENKNAKIAIDPGQNCYLFNLKSLIPRKEWESITHLLVSHGDPDHHWQSDRVAKESGAYVICGKDLCRIEKGKTLLVDPRGKELTSWIPFENVYPLAVNEDVTLDDVNITGVKSVHGPITIPFLFWKIRKYPGPDERTGIGSMGFKISIDNRTIINLGDSILLEDWTDLKPDLLMLPIGGLGNNDWTMDVHEAIKAVQAIKPQIVIPCHYNVPFLWKKNFNPADDSFFKSEIEKHGMRCEIMKYGDTIKI